MSKRILGIALSIGERAIAVVATRELAARLDGDERERALEVAAMLDAAVRLDDRGLQLALTGFDEETA